MLIRTFLLVALAGMVFGLSSPSNAQPERARLWVGGGLGYGGAGAGPNTEAGGHVSGRIAARILTGRTAITARTTATTGGASRYSRFAIVGSGTVYDGFHDAGLLVGYALPLGRNWEATGSAGLAVVWGTRAISNGCYSFCLSSGESEPFTPRLGFPAELEVSARLRESLRLGLLGYGNVNAEETFGGLLLVASIRL